MKTRIWSKRLSTDTFVSTDTYKLNTGTVVRVLFDLGQGKFSLSALDGTLIDEGYANSKQKLFKKAKEKLVSWGIPFKAEPSRSLAKESALLSCTGCQSCDE
jgi:hypothetical protein